MKGARWYRKLLGILWIASISGITLALGGLAGNLMDAGFYPSLLDWKAVALNGLTLAGWGMICCVSYRGSRHNLAQPTWALSLIVGLIWAGILLNRLA
jgi:hypothetical protein